MLLYSFGVTGLAIQDIGFPRRKLAARLLIVTVLHVLCDYLDILFGNMNDFLASVDKFFTY